MSDSGWRLLKPLARRRYRLLLGALAAALLGDGMWTFAMVWQVIGAGGTQAQVSIVATSLAVGILVSALFGGVIADRLSKRRILVAVQLAKTLAVASCAAVVLFGQGQLWFIAAAAFVVGSGTALFIPAYTALLPTVLPPDELLAANGFEGALRPAFGLAVGPAMSGLIAEVVSPGVAMAATAGVFALSSVALVVFAAVGAPAEQARESPRLGALLGDIRQGLAYLVKTPWLLGSTVCNVLMALAVMGPFQVLLPFVIADRLGGGAVEHSWIRAAFGIAGMVTSLIVGGLGMPRRYLSAIIVCLGIACLPLSVFGLASDLVWMVLAGAAIGVFATAPVVWWGTVLQRRVPSEMLGRVASLDFFTGSVLTPVSLALAGPVSVLIGIQQTFVIAAIAPLVVCLVVIVVARMPADEITHPLTAKQSLA